METTRAEAGDEVAQRDGAAAGLEDVQPLPAHLFLRGGGVAAWTWRSTTSPSGVPTLRMNSGMSLVQTSTLTTVEAGKCSVVIWVRF